MPNDEVSLTLYDLESGLFDAVLQAMEVQDDLAIISHSLEIATAAGNDDLVANCLERRQDAEERLKQSRAVVQAYLEGAVQKRDRVARFLAHLDSQATLAADEIRRLTARKRTLENAAASLKSHVVHLMQTMGVRKLEGETSTLSLRKAPGHVEVTDLGELPAPFKKTEVVITPLKKEIGAALKAGEKLAGAKWIEGGDYLTVK